MIATPYGLRWILHEATDYLAIDLEIGEVQGRLVGPIRIRDLRYQDQAGNVAGAGNIDFDWHPRALFDGTLHARRIVVDRPFFRQSARGRDSKSEATLSLPDIRLPLGIRLDMARATDIQVHSPDAPKPVSIALVQIQAHTDDRDVVVDTLQVAWEDNSIAVHGRVTPTADYPLDINVSWIVRDPSLLLPLRGRSAVSGSLELLAVKTSLESPASGQLDLEITTPLDTLRWRGRLSLHPVDLVALNARWPQWRVSGDLEGQGDLGRVEVSGSVNGDHDAWGALSSKIGLQWASRLLRVERMELARVGTPSTISVSGQLGFPVTESVSFDLKGNWTHIAYPWQGPTVWATPEGRFAVSGDLDAFTLELEGAVENAESDSGALYRVAKKISIEAEVQDPQGKPKLRAKARIPNVRFAAYTVDDLRADIDVDVSDIRTSRVDVFVAGLRAEEQAIRELRIRGEGRTTEHSLEILGSYRDSEMRIAATGGIRGSAWTGFLGQFDVADVLGTDWSLVPGDVRLDIATDMLRTDNVCWIGSGARVCVAAQWSIEAGWNAELALYELSASHLGEFMRSDLDWTGTVSGDVRAGAKPNAPLTADAEIVTGPGSLSFRSEDGVVAIPYGDVSVTVAVQENRLLANLTGTLDDQGKVAGAVSIHDIFDTEKPKPIQAEAGAQLASLDLVRALMPDLGVEGGALDVRLKVGGDTSRPTLHASAQLSDAAFAIPQTGTRLEAIEIRLESEDESSVRLTGSARAGAGVLNVSGGLRFTDTRTWSTALRIEGAEVLAANLPEVRITLSPDLNLRFQPGRLDVTGGIFVDEAILAPELAAGSQVTLSPDIVIVAPQGEQTASALATHAKIRIELGDRVSFEGYGLTGKLRGKLEVVHEPSKLTVAVGQVEILEGIYALYGRKLEIETGRLNFAGGSIDNPGIEARIVRKSGGVIVTASVKGTLRDPELTLTSEPDMPDTDKLSYLIFGRGAKQIGKGDATLLLSAASTLLPKGGSIGVTERLKSAFGLETLTVESDQNSNGDAVETSLVLGKYLTPRLYVSYAAGLANTLNVFRMRYELSKRWLLQTESSTRESGGDILYSIER